MAPVTTSRHFIIGTAGHVDHGKTALIRALTGAETDRLAEEQERGMSIDLGFADFTLPGGRRAGVIDVPGHERFLKNMLAGAGGIDLVLLVVAADEGMMPQTREHLDILQVLQTRRGVVVLTKRDLVDEEWLELVREDLRKALAGTFLAEAPMVSVSAVTGEGIPELVELLSRMADEVPTRPIVGPWRLPIDRVFTIQGFGTVVTGTLLTGIARVGDRVALLPGGRESRIRNIQVHGQSVDHAEAGTRVALNLAGVDVDQLERGMVAAPPGAYPESWAIETRLEVLPTCPREVKHRTRVRLHLGSAEIQARVNLLDAETLPPGSSGLVQLRLERPTVAARGMRYVLRFYSPPDLIGGGSVIASSEARHRRFDPKVLEALRLQERGTPEQLVAEAVSRSGLTPVAPQALAASLEMPLEEVRRHLAALAAAGTVIVHSGESVLHRDPLEAAEHQLLTVLGDYHAAQPMRAGMSREELRSRLARHMDTRGFNLVCSRLEADGRMYAEGSRVRRAGHEPVFPPPLDRVRDALIQGMLRSPWNPPLFPDLVAAGGLAPRQAQEVWDALIDNGEIVRLSSDVFLHRSVVEEAVAKVRSYLQENPSLTAAQLRDLLGTTRKFAVPLAEYLDAQRVTRRIGDERVAF